MAVLAAAAARKFGAVFFYFQSHLCIVVTWRDDDGTSNWFQHYSLPTSFGDWFNCISIAAATANTRITLLVAIDGKWTAVSSILLEKQQLRETLLPVLLLLLLLLLLMTLCVLSSFTAFAVPCRVSYHCPPPPPPLRMAVWWRQCDRRRISKKVKYKTKANVNSSSSSSAPFRNHLPWRRRLRTVPRSQSISSFLFSFCFYYPQHCISPSLSAAAAAGADLCACVRAYVRVCGWVWICADCLFIAGARKSLKSLSVPSSFSSSPLPPPPPPPPFTLFSSYSMVDERSTV